ncbi:MAG: branched-chain amino acid transport system substrate-binding protein [Tepidanaerobacteraceae bacterium]|nr:branched-chain amino acid transport system substrate-binding protein [Tepidanaerobacteraceae bacterium]
MLKKGLALVLFVFLALMMFGCGSQQSSQQSSNSESQSETKTEEKSFDGEIKVGLIMPLTGSEATYGKDMENAMIMAADEINDSGGVLGKKLVTVSADDAADPQQASAAANKLVSSGVMAVVGSYASGATLPTLAIFGDAHIPHIITVANSTKLINENRGNAIMINGTALHQGDKAVELFQDIWKVDSIVIVHQGDAYSEDLANITKQKWEEAGHKVLGIEVANKGEQDYSSIVTSIKSKNPDAVYWTAYYADGALFIKQLRQRGYEGKIAVGDGCNSPKLMEIAGSAADGVVCTSNPMAEYLPAAKDFIQKYKSRYNQDPGPYSSLSYDGIYLLKDAIERAGSTDKEAIIKALRETKGFKGISGEVTITDDGTLAKSNFVLLEAKDGKWNLMQ